MVTGREGDEGGMDREQGPYTRAVHLRWSSLRLEFRESLHSRHTAAIKKCETHLYEMIGKFSFLHTLGNSKLHNNNA